MKPYQKKCTDCGDYGWAIESRKESDFYYKRHERKDGSFRINFDGKCKPCRRTLERAKSAAKYNRTTKGPIDHVGPTGIFKDFLCTLRPTNIDDSC